jgi:hypothetical protein
VSRAPCTDSEPCGTERIVASDATGLHAVDSIRYPGYGTFLTGLTLNGDALGWYDYGNLRTVTLTPP